MTKLFTLLAAATLLSACVVEPEGRARVYSDSVAVEVDSYPDRYYGYHDYPVYYRTRHSYYHCPPGHAKKGWC